MEASDLITTTEAAELLGVGRSTVTRWVDDGRLTPARKLAGLRGAWLFDRDTITKAAGK